jgi:hypothetical protein
MIRLWAEAWAETIVQSWSGRRGDDGGMLDDVALMGALAAAAILVGVAVGAFLVGKVSSINIGW